MRPFPDKILPASMRLGRRGSIAVWIAVMMPGLIMGLSLGLEVTNWEATQISLQRAADVAATAGVINYNASGNSTIASNYTTYMAQLNGVPANQITVAPVNGLQNTSDQAMQVTVSKTVPSLMSTVFRNQTSYTVSATSKAEWVTLTSSSGSGGQPCLVALSSSGSITGAGSTTIDMPNCTIVSNGSITVTGGGSLTTGGIYYVGSDGIQSWITTTPTPIHEAKVIPDPYAGNTALQNALTSASSLTGQTNIACGSVQGSGPAGQNTGSNNCNGTNTLPHGGTCVTNSSTGVTCTLYPGTYGSFIISGGPYTFNFQPGLYEFSGAVSLADNSTSNGSGVTIITAGAFTGSNTFNFNLTAPTSAQASSTGTGGIAGVVLATSSTSGVTLSGSVAFDVTGVVYSPNGPFNASGSSGNPPIGSASVSCLEIIATTIELTGASYFNSNCSSLGAASFYSIAGSSTQSSQLVH
jgi:Flp pilus assembly protein TadG